MTISIGDRFGEWTVMALTRRPSRVIASCSCGQTKREMQTRHLANGISRGCVLCVVTRGPRRRRPRLSVGETFGSWTVIALSVQGRGERTAHLCRCDCGIEQRIQPGNLIQGNTRSCRSCSARANSAVRTHGMTGSKEYAAWASMKRRCSDESDVNYAGRGIVVCDEWAGPDGFAAFYDHIGAAPGRGREWSVDRIDNSRGYEPGNVRWATARQQMRNTRRARLINVGGELLTMQDAGERLGISRQAIHQRIGWGWTPAEAATTPRGALPARLRAEQDAARERARDAARERASEAERARGEARATARETAKAARKAARAARSVALDGHRFYRCGCCGEFGHNARSCEAA